MISQKALDVVCKNKEPSEVKNFLLGIEDVELRNRCIAIWACEYGFENLKPEYLPNPPQELKDYRFMGKEQKRVFIKRYQSERGLSFWEAEEIKEFLDEEQKTIHRNRDYENWLKEILTYLTDEDEVYKVRVKKRLEEFDRFYGRTVFKNDVPEEAKEVVSAFGGRVVEEWED